MFQYNNNNFCFHYLRGKCRFGFKCKHIHICPQELKKDICRNFECKYYHARDIDFIPCGFCGENPCKGNIRGGCWVAK